MSPRTFIVLRMIGGLRPCLLRLLYVRLLKRARPKHERVIKSMRYILSHDENTYSNLPSKAKNRSCLRAARGRKYIGKTSSKPIHLNTAVSSV
ncbi:hypothetical protein [Priestia megaterium]|uniref:hypothetical protein n=1 Tax=Priestia megaterium TaxID=1404 RepID=UPI00203CFD64|nr:hypothetical protein [Priestia megaterium]MCM3187129.1 hypothetical protein [Priestia megaterium]